MITIESKPGKGTEVLINLRAQKEDKKPTPAKKKLISETATKKIFVVEDEKMIRDLYVEVLSMNGHQVTSVSSGEEGLEKWTGNNYDLIICDLGLPGINGWEFVAKIRENDKNVPIIVLTGWGHEFNESAAAEKNVQKILSKPIKIENLLGSIDEIA